MNNQTKSNEITDLELPEPSKVLKSSSETDLTYQLKWAAWRWLYTEVGCRSIGMEVKLEGPFGRVVDLVGVGKGNTVYIVEVKSSRGDLRRDDKTKTDRRRALAQLKALEDAATLTATVLDDARKHAVETTDDGADWRDNPVYVAARRDHDDIKDRIALKEADVGTIFDQIPRSVFLGMCRLPLPCGTPRTRHACGTTTVLGIDRRKVRVRRSSGAQASTSEYGARVARYREGEYTRPDEGMRSLGQPRLDLNARVSRTVPVN